MFYYATQPMRIEESAMETLHCTIQLDTARALLALVKGTQQMAGEDGYYGYICRCCDKRFTHEGEKRHEDWCLVPLAEKLAPDFRELEAYVKEHDRTQELLRALP